jgi:hypothetical protein
MLEYGKKSLELENVTSDPLLHIKVKNDDDDSQADGLVANFESNTRGRNKSRGMNSKENLDCR